MYVTRKTRSAAVAFRGGKGKLDCFVEKTTL
jgi:hypothetical protein